MNRLRVAGAIENGLGTTEVESGLREEIEARCRPDPLRSLDAEIIATGRAGAERTKTWLATPYTWEVEGETYPVEPWVAYVVDLAEQILNDDRRGDRAEMSAAMVRFALGDTARAADVLERGLKGPCNEDSTCLRRLLRILVATGLSPVEEPEFGDHDPCQVLFEKSGDRWDFATSA
jgi:hypothetical protein